MTESAERVSAINAWLLSEPHRGGDGAGFARALAARLVEAGAPLWRMSYALMTVHPEVLWRTVQWRAGEITLRDQPRARLDDPFYTRSAVATARKERVPLRVRLVDGDLPYPICVDLRDEGATDYFVLPLAFTNGQITYTSFATRAPGGFSDADLELLRSLGPSLAMRLELESAYYATHALLEVYLGKNAARRVLSGAVERGRGELIDAVIWFCDMRGFTELGERMHPARVVTMLDAYFDAMASAVAEHGGEVLKFIGDAVLAIFPIGDDPRMACRRALDAADTAFASLARVNAARAADGEDALTAGVALHLGPVLYGNIGSRDRLDFTVISTAVNATARLESLCKELGTPLAMSAAFLEVAAIDDVVDRGEHALKGLLSPLHVFTRRPR